MNEIYIKYKHILLLVIDFYFCLDCNKTTISDRDLETKAKKVIMESNLLISILKQIR